MTVMVSVQLQDQLPTPPVEAARPFLAKPGRPPLPWPTPVPLFLLSEADSAAAALACSRIRACSIWPTYGLLGIMLSSVSAAPSGLFSASTAQAL